LDGGQRMVLPSVIHKPNQIIEGWQSSLPQDAERFISSLSKPSSSWVH
jgi:hypothetical protein